MSVDRSPAPRPRVWRALLWKEWRQLRHLRWACAGLGTLVPVFFIAGAEAGRQGLSPFGRVASYSMSSILTDAVPGALAFAVWPLAALLLVAQAFAGDRSSGTEAFLLERPVSRPRIWAARLAASTASLVAVLMLTSGLWGLWFGMAGLASSPGWSQPLEMLALGAGLAILIAICGVLSSTLLPSPLLAILAAALLGALPAIISVGLGRMFPYARWGGLPIGTAVPWLLIPAYLVASFVASCYGEPAGRGRASKGLGTLGLSLIAIAFMFVMSAQALLRLDARTPNAWEGFQPAPVGDAALIGSNSVWLVDTKTAEVRDHYPAPCIARAWKPDGTMFALATYSGPLGSEGRSRVSFFDVRGEPSAAPYFSETADPYFRLKWSKDRLIIREDETLDLGRLIAFIPGKSEVARMDMRLPMSAWDYAGSLWDGSDAIARVLPDATIPSHLIEGQLPRTPEERESRRITYGLYRADIAHGRIEEEPLVVERGSPSGARSRLSPDGRWWLRETVKGESQEMVELATGRVVPRSRGGWPDDPARFYLSQDADGTSLIREGPDRVATTLRSWGRAPVSLSTSPGGKYLLVRKQRAGDPAREPGTVLEDFVYDVGAGSWKDLGPALLPEAGPGSESGARNYQRQWAGPHTLARVSNGSLAFEDVESIGALRFVLGGP